MPPGDGVPDLDQEPIIDTVFLNKWLETDMPLRGKYRQRVLQRMRENIRQRRTVDAFSQRAAGRAITPITSAVEQELQDMTSEQIKKALDNVLETE